MLNFKLEDEDGLHDDNMAVPNKRLLFHGSRPSNFLGILSRFVMFTMFSVILVLYFRCYCLYANLFVCGVCV